MDEMVTADTAAPRALPTWFWAAAGLILLWEIFGVVSYLIHVTVDPATLPLDQRAMMEAAPTWMYAAFAVAVWVGLIGAVLLLLRRRHATTLLLISLVAIVVQFSALLIDPALRQITPSDALLMPILIFVGSYAAFMFSRLAQRRGWLR